MDARTQAVYRPEQDVLDRLGIETFPDYHQMILRDKRRFDPRYGFDHKRALRKYNRARAKVQRLQDRLNRHRPPDQKIVLTCSNQARIEAKWYLEETADFDGFDAALNRIYQSMKNHDQPQNVAWQNPEDGAFGCGYTRFHLQCDAMIEAVYELYDDGKNPIAPDYPFDFLERISTPEKMVAYLEPLITSDIAVNGHNDRDQIGAITGSMSQLIYKSYLRDYVKDYVKGFEITDAYKDAYTKLLDDWQDPATGFWGEWFEHRGRLYKSPDLSLTYHTVKYRKGKVQHWDMLIDTLFAIKRCHYPYGWFVHGHMNNHNSMDVVKIFKLGWDKMSSQQQDRAREDMHEMLDWCLNDSLEADGDFKYFPFYNSHADAFYFGVAFLDAVGYLNPSNRFWTDETFPGWQDTGCRIKKRLRELGLDDHGQGEAAMEILDQDLPDC